jgi:hypothetical protein
MRNYQSALDHYISRPVPPRSKLWKAMPDNARPLQRTAYTHYGIHKRNEDQAIIYRLYDTNVATIYPPNKDGNTLVECRYYDSPLTNNFIWSQGLHYYRLNTTEGKEVCVPYVHSDAPYGDPKPATAKLMMDKDGKLIVSQSWHADIATRVSTTEDKAKRKELAKQLDGFMMLIGLRIDQYRTNCTLDRDYGRPFAMEYRQPESIKNVRDFVNGADAKEIYKIGDVLNDAGTVDELVEMGQGVFDILASKRAYDGGLLNYYSRTRQTAEELQAANHAIIRGVSTEDFLKSYRSRLQKLVGIKEGTGFKIHGQFRESIPRKWYIASRVADRIVTK